MSGTDTIEKYMEGAVLVPYKEMVLISLGNDTGVCVPWIDEMFTVDVSSTVDEVYKELLSIYPKPEDSKVEPAKPDEAKFDEAKSDDTKIEPNVKDPFKWKHFSSLITRKSNNVRYIKIPIDADLSVRYYMEFGDRPTYVGKWFIKSHENKAYTPIIQETAELLISSADEYQLISGISFMGKYYKTVLSHKKGCSVNAELIIE